MTVRSLFPILLTRDLPSLTGFYERALGGVVGYRFAAADADVYVSLAVGEASLGIAYDPDAADAVAGDRVALWFSVDDVDAAFAAFVAAGGDAVSEPADMPWGERVARARDLDGNLVDLGTAAA